MINYKTDPNWGESVKALTPDRAGAHHIVEVGGPTTLAQSLKSIRPDGVITIIGFLGGYSKDQPSFVEALLNVCIVRGILVGSRQQFEAMNRAIDAIGLKPVVDPKTFALEDLKDAYQYMVRISEFSGRNSSANYVCSGNRNILYEIDFNCFMIGWLTCGLCIGKIDN